MKISINTIRKINQIYGSASDPAPDGVDALVEKIGAQLGAVEGVMDFGRQFREVLIVKVEKCEKHPNADKLSLCTVNDGGKTKDIERDENGHIQVVCGAENVRAGMLAAWLPPGSTVPNTLDKDPFVLESRELRGKVSHGMLASAHELGIGTDHSGIVEIDRESEPGTPFNEVYDLVNEAVIDIENKMFTHRPDCFGFLGVSREIEGISQRKYKSPDWYTTDPDIPEIETEELRLSINNQIPELVPRFTAIAMRDVEVKPSPLWLQIFLTEMGMKPVNNIVDYTNYFMLETGQPIHAYDYDKVADFSKGDGAVIDVRHPNGEEITVLGGKTIKPHKQAMMVAAGDKLICVGGTIGGVNSEVSKDTKNIILEAANWDMYAIRKTAMIHGIYTDAVARFTKGQSPLQNKAVILKIVDEIRKYAGGKVASSLIDDNNLDKEVVANQSLFPPVTTTAEFINDRLGTKLSNEEIVGLLENVEFDAKLEGNDITVTAPFWRTDIEIAEDLVEEVGRLYGFDKVRIELPARSITPASKNSNLELKTSIRKILAESGANEMLTYSFASGSLLEKSGQDKKMAYKIANALSPDLQYYRMSLLPSLLDKVHMNQKAGHLQFRAFEIGKTHQKGLDDDDGLPLETESLALIYSNADGGDKSGPAYYQAKLYLTNLLRQISSQLSFISLSEYSSEGLETPQWLKPYEPGRTAIVMRGGEAVGAVGEFKAAVKKALKLPQQTAGFEVGLAYLSDAFGKAKYSSLSRFPEVEQDISLKVPKEVAYADLKNVVKGSIDQNKPDDTVFEISPLDIYQRDDDKDHKQIAFRLTIKSYIRTLQGEEVNSLLDKAADAAGKELEAARL